MCMHADTHVLYQSQGFCQRMCQHSHSYFSPGQSSRSQIQAEVVMCGRVCVCCQRARVTCALVCSHFFYFQSRSFVCACAFVSARPSLWVLLHKRPQKPQTMRRASAQETDFCPTPTNRKLLLHPPHPAFVSHADTHTHTHRTTGSVIMLYSGVTRFFVQTKAWFSRGGLHMEKPINVSICTTQF